MRRKATPPLLVLTAIAAFLSGYIFSRLSTDVPAPDDARSNAWQSIWKKKGHVSGDYPLHHASGFNALSEEQWDNVVCNLTSQLALRPGMSVIDFGCGAGAFVNSLRSSDPGIAVLRCKHGRGIDVYGLDYSHSLVEVAKARVDPRPARFMVADVRDVSFLSDENFDAAVSFSVFFYLNSLEDARKALSEMVRVVKPGGLLCVADVSDLSRQELALKMRSESEFYTKQQQKLADTSPSHLYYPKKFFKEVGTALGLVDIVFVDEYTLGLSYYEPSNYRFTMIARRA